MPVLHLKVYMKISVLGNQDLLCTAKSLNDNLHYMDYNYHRHKAYLYPLHAVARRHCMGVCSGHWSQGMVMGDDDDTGDGDDNDDD